MVKQPERPAFTFNMFTTTSQLKRFLQAFEGFEADWESQGYESLSSKEADQRLSGKAPYPPEWKTEGPINFAFGPPHFIQFIAFLKEPATTAALEVIFAGILHATLHRFRGFFAGRSGKVPVMQFPIKFCPSLWFEREQVLVTIVADIESPGDFRPAELLIPEGFIRARQWLDRHGVTHPYLTYYIRNGRLDVKPTLSQQSRIEPGTVTTTRPRR
jgi:hypothetical protein